MSETPLTDEQHLKTDYNACPGAVKLGEFFAKPMIDCEGEHIVITRKGVVLDIEEAMDKKCYLPSEEDIRRATAEIRAGWTQRDFVNRGRTGQVGVDGPKIREVSTADVEAAYLGGW